MDVVVRTPHGDADLEIVAAPTDSTLADLLRAVTGQAPPADVPRRWSDRVDGSVAQRIGSRDRIVDRHPTHHRHARRCRVHRWRRRTRPAHRPWCRNRPHVDAGSVSQSAVHDVSTLPRWRLRPSRLLRSSSRSTMSATSRSGRSRTRAGALGAYTPTLANQLLDRERQWIDGRLHVGGRLFELDRPAVIDRAPTTPRAGCRWVGSVPTPAGTPAGTASTRRRRDSRRSERRWPAVATSSERSARVRHPVRDRRRRSQHSRRSISGGIAEWHSSAPIDSPPAWPARSSSRSARCTVQRTSRSSLRRPPIESPNGTGRSGFRTSAREFRPQHHVCSPTPRSWRAGHPSRRNSSAVPRSDDRRHRRSDRFTGWKPPTVPTSPSPVTLLVLDDIALWSQRDSPIRSLLIDPPPELRIMALCVGLHEAPGLCTSLLEEVPPATRLAQLSSAAERHGDREPRRCSDRWSDITVGWPKPPQVVEDIRPALVETPQAADVARQLAPLDDLDSRRRILPPTRLAAPPLAELVDESARRSSSRRSRCVDRDRGRDRVRSGGAPRRHHRPDESAVDDHRCVARRATRSDRGGHRARRSDSAQSRRFGDPHRRT